MIYEQLVAKIQATLEAVSAIKAIYPYPTESVTAYPAAIFFPVAFQNTFESTRDNHRVYRFALYVTMSATQKSVAEVFGSVLPKAVDAVVAQFDEDWDVGTIEGHRCWVLVNSGTWSIATQEKGLEATAELTVEIRLNTNAV